MFRNSLYVYDCMEYVVSVRVGHWKPYRGSAGKDSKYTEQDVQYSVEDNSVESSTFQTAKDLLVCISK